MARQKVNMFHTNQLRVQADSDQDTGEDYEFTISMVELGAEGMQAPLQEGGSTYKTTWKQTTRKEIPVIVKMLTRLNFAEAQRLYYVGHKNIVRFYGAIIEPPVYGIVVELCNGPSLFDYLCQNPKPDLELALNLAQGIASGLAYLHEGATDAGPIKHAQLTSAKVILHEKGGKLIPKIGGFGYSRKNKGTQMTGSFGRMQCFQWMAPELIKGRRSQLASDVYSFGIILWELLTGEVPYKGKMMYEAMHDITNGKHLTIPDDCPTDLQDLMKHCWAELPNDRPSLRTILVRLEFHPQHPEEVDYQQEPSGVVETLDSVNEWENMSYDKVELGESIGKGRMGNTDRATYQGKQIVIKSFFKPLVTRESFESYMRDVSLIEHENIIKILGGFVDERVLVMESMATSLRRKLQTGPITNKRVLKRIARGVACGLDHLHSQRPSHLVHGSLTSTNILLDEKDNAKIADIYYMRLDKVSAMVDLIYVDRNSSRMETAGDVYSFGIVLIEMRAGEIPSRSSRQAYTHVNETWPALYSLAKHCVSSNHRPAMKGVIEALDKLE